MKWMRSVLLGSVLLLGLSVPSHADDFAGLGLPFRGTPEASEGRMRALLTAMGATEHTATPGGVWVRVTECKGLWRLCAREAQGPLGDMLHRGRSASSEASV